MNWVPHQWRRGLQERHVSTVATRRSAKGRGINRLSRLTEGRDYSMFSQDGGRVGIIMIFLI